MKLISQRSVLTVRSRADLPKLACQDYWFHQDLSAKQALIFLYLSVGTLGEQFIHYTGGHTLFL